MKLFDKKSLILLISVISINLLCIISVSYAYFTAQIVGNDKAEDMVVKAGTMEITYYDSNEVSLNSMLPGDSLIKKFKIVNKGTLDTKYNIKIDIETDEFEDYSDLKYTLTKNDGLPSEEKVLPYEDGYIIKDEEIGKGATDSYTLTLSFKKDDTNQNDNANKKLNFKIEVDSKDDVELYEYKEPYRDNSGANRPKLYQGMIPIYFNDGKIYIADVTQEWYNYDEHEWGNAVLIDNTNEQIRNKFYNEDGTLRINNQITEEDILQMYVWIPRYKYQLFNANNERVKKQIINIEFEKGVTSTGNVTCKYTNEGNGTIREDCQNAINGNWYTHPAFTFGDTELPGIWVGKFESSDPTDTIGYNLNLIGGITIVPNKISMVRKNVKTLFDETRGIESNAKYGLTKNEIDTHIIKNIDWGAVAYLTQSIYGIYNYNGEREKCYTEECEVWVNNVTQTNHEPSSWQDVGAITGCTALNYNDGPEWNTDPSKIVTCPEERRWNTPNGMKASTTGNVYGIYDMAGGMNEVVMAVIVAENTGAWYPCKSEIAVAPNKKYYDIYSFSNSWITWERGHLGDASRELLIATFLSWNDDVISMPGVSATTDEDTPWFSRGGRLNENSNLTSGIFALDRYSGGSNSTRTLRVVLTAQDGID